MIRSRTSPTPNSFTGGNPAGLLAIALIALALLPARVQAQDQTTFELGLEGSRFGNFFQAPDDADEVDVEALGFGASITIPFATGWSAVLGAGARNFSEGLATAVALTGGVELDREFGRGHLILRRESDRPILDVGDSLGTADVLYVDAEYGHFVLEDLELKGQLALQRQGFEASPLRDNTIYGVGPALRYHGFGSIFSPEVGILFGERDATDPGESHDQTDWYLQLRSSPSRSLYLSARYRHRTRDYTVGDLDDSNFGRRDVRDQITVLAIYPADRPLAVSLYLSRQSADSTRPARTFDSSLAILGLRARF